MIKDILSLAANHNKITYVDGFGYFTTSDTYKRNNNEVTVETLRIG